MTSHPTLVWERESLCRVNVEPRDWSWRSHCLFCFAPQICWRWWRCQIRYRSCCVCRCAWVWVYVQFLLFFRSSIINLFKSFIVFVSLCYSLITSSSGNVSHYSWQLRLLPSLSVFVSVCVIQQMFIDRSSFVWTDLWMWKLSPPFICYAARNMRWHCWFDNGSIGQDTVKPGANEASLTLTVSCVATVMPFVMHSVHCGFIREWEYF